MPHHTTVRTALNLVNDQQLGVAASMLDLSGGGVRAESCTLVPSLEWLLKALTVFGVSLSSVPHGVLDVHSVAACCRLCDAWTTIGESLQPQPSLVQRLDRIFGVESSEARARREADGEAALNVAAAPFPAPNTKEKKIYAKPLVLTQRPFLRFSELQGRVDGVFVIIRASTGDAVVRHTGESIADAPLRQFGSSRVLHEGLACLHRAVRQST